MTVAIFFVLIYSTIQVGGIGVVVDNARQLPGYFSFTTSYVAETGTSQPYSLLTIVSTLAWGLGYFGMPHILLRFMAIEDEHKLKISRRVASVWVTIAMAVAVMIGVVGREMSSQGLVEFLSGTQTETIIVKVADLLSKHGIFPALMAGLILAGILASTMSTSDSQMLAASSSLTSATSCTGATSCGTLPAVRTTSRAMVSQSTATGLPVSHSSMIHSMATRANCQTT